MTTPVTASNPLDQKRECDCPTWVVRCEHLDGVVLGLADFGKYKLPETPRYCIGVRPAGTLDVECLCAGAGYSSHEDAFAAFYAAEEALLRGPLA